MKKLTALLLCLVLSVACLAGCGSETSSDDAITAENIKIGFVHISDPSDLGYTYNHDLGTQAMKEKLGLKDEQIINKYNIPETAECETAINELIEAGCNLIFATSFGHEQYVVAAAQEHPEIQFFHATGNQAASANLPNYHNYFTQIYQARYLAGIAAGLKTQTNLLGYVGAFAFAEVISGYDAFYLGAKSVNPDVQMYVMYTSSWNDPTAESQVAQALIDMGCDVISQHSDSTAPATTAEQNGVWQVGYNSDMIPAAPNASLISARSDWSVYLIYAVETYLAGGTVDTDWCKGLAEGAVYLSDLNTTIAAEGTQEAIDAAKAKMLGGWDVYTGPLYDNTGALVLEEGQTFIEPQSAPSWSHVLQGITVFE